MADNISHPEFEEGQAEAQHLLNYYVEDIDFELVGQDILSTWILQTAKHEGLEVDEVSYIFCSDAHLHGINLQYLQHDTYTDIITFPYEQPKKAIAGDIYISVERVIENAQEFAVSFGVELHRVMIHGILHLLGYVDASDDDKKFMRQKEDYYLQKLMELEQSLQ
jgi:rRNA maturation RNase YbeY